MSAISPLPRRPRCPIRVSTRARVTTTCRPAPISPTGRCRSRARGWRRAIRVQCSPPRSIRGCRRSRAGSWRAHRWAQAKGARRSRSSRCGAMARWWRWSAGGTTSNRRSTASPRRAASRVRPSRPSSISPRWKPGGSPMTPSPIPRSCKAATGPRMRATSIPNRSRSRTLSLSRPMSLRCACCRRWAARR